MTIKMKISHVEVAAVNIDLKRATSTKKNNVATVFVRIQTDQGISGYGEGTPSTKAFPGETQASTVEIIKNKLIAALIGENPLAIPRIIDKMDRVIQGQPAAKTAIDLALHDLLGKALGVPVHVLLGGLFQQALPVFELLEMADANESAKAAKALVSEGVLNLKIKVGYNFVEDLRRLGAVREAAGKKAFIKADANQKWSVYEAISFLKKAEDEGWIDCMEQPINAFDHEGTNKIKAFTSIPIMADEAIICLEDAANLVRKQAYDFYNIKISRIGGLYKARRFVEIVGAFGYHCMAGAGFNSMLLDAAGCHLFASSPQVIFQELKSSRGFWLNDQVTKGLKITGGMLNVPMTPGLGVEVDEAVFKK